MILLKTIRAVDLKYFLEFVRRAKGGIFMMLVPAADYYGQWHFSLFLMRQLSLSVFLKESKNVPSGNKIFVGGTQGVMYLERKHFIENLISLARCISPIAPIYYFKNTTSQQVLRVLSTA